MNLRTLDFLQTSRLAAETAQIKEAGTANLGRTDSFHLIHDLAVEREDALDALAEAHLAHGEAALRAVLAGDDHALESLNALFVAFFDLYLNTNCIPRRKGGQVVAVQ